METALSLLDVLSAEGASTLDIDLAAAALFPITGADPSEVSVAVIWNEVLQHGGSVHELIEPYWVDRFANGAGVIAQRIAKEIEGDLRFAHGVSHIEDCADHVVVSGNFTPITAKKCIIALPLQVLSALSFTPDLSKEQHALSRQGNAGRTIKLWALVEGREHPEVCFVAGHKVRFTYAKKITNTRYLICAQALADELDNRDVDSLKAIFKMLYPKHKIINVDYYDWVANPLSQGSWQASRVGHFLGVATQFQTQGNLTFCGSDFADTWCGWIEGAILSGQRAARLYA
jgi:monoamine oxidase